MLARLRILAVAVVVAVPGLSGFAQAAEGDESYLQVVDITFPVSGAVSYSDTYDAPRSGGRLHQATDIVGVKLQAVHAAAEGQICWITGIDEPMPSYGYMIRICGDDGRTYSYVHLNNDTPGTDDGAGGPQWAYAPGMVTGVRVERGQWIAYVGDSGNAEATVPHLHFEISDPEVSDPYDGTRINPYNSLRAAQDRGDVPAEPRKPEVSLQRLAGSSRVETAVALSQSLAAPAATVVVVPAGSHAEALAAAPLAALVSAPVLLTGPDGLHPAVAAEVARLGARNAYVVGRADQLSPATESDLADAGVTAGARLYASDRYQLSADIAREMRSYPGVGEFSKILLALGDSPEPSRAWPDALSASALAAQLKVPILLTEGDALPAPVRDVLAELRPDEIVVIGGTAAITDAVATAAAQASGAATVSRLAGATRFGTSVAVAQAGIAAGLRAPSVWVATGLNYPDALAAGPAAAAAGAPLLLVHGDAVGGGPESEAWLASQNGRLTAVTVVGGIAVVSDPVADNVRQLLGS
ncbi:MAG TPA: cell wall-binding repeat-containing protein [Egibacteraceae bacterium]|nr:cell wall-binding repeat-containing protein [Egibacteraceae bacterium]